MDSAADDDTMARAMAWLAEALVLRHELEERDWMSAEEGESEAAGLARNGEAGAAASAAGLEKEDASMIGEFDYSDLPPLLAEALLLLLLLRLLLLFLLLVGAALSARPSMSVAT